MEEEHAVKAPLSDAFLQFLETNGLDPSIYTAIDSTPRYIRLQRLKSGFESCIEEVEAEVKCKLEKLEWLLGFYSLPPHIQIAGSRAYREGKAFQLQDQWNLTFLRKSVGQELSCFKSLADEHLEESEIDVIASLLNGRLVRKTIGPTMFSVVQSQVICFAQS
ncbi:hypothetical protein JHK82_040007 [Glycine max]|nr:hypothetical protein JHK82_040007 [Glycine max]KAG5122079.1 hypothetical protein JHK84_040419 [Glycine max]